MIEVVALLAVASWKALEILDWVGGAEARRVQRWVGIVFLPAILIPIYLFGDRRPFDAVVEEVVKPIVSMTTDLVERAQQ
jgi:hypothetical protein